MVISLTAVTRSRIVASFLAARSRKARGSLFKIGTCGLMKPTVPDAGVAGAGPHNGE